MPSPIISLGQKACRDPKRTGGKGAGLARLTALGFAVPPGFVLSTSVFDDSLRNTAGGEHVRDSDRVLGEIPPGVQRRLLEHARQLGGPFAVRSSLVGEDGPRTSMAGQLSTFLDVADETELVEAIQRCYASAFGHTISVYREQLDRDGAGLVSRPSLAVVVQRMQPSQVVGVAFSADPLTGERCVIVEAAAGSPDAVVSGRVDPCRWRVDARGVIVEARPGATSHDLLAEKCVLELAQAVRRIGVDLADPVDVEWCWDGERFWFLQARPVSSLAGRHIFSNRLVSDMSPGLIKPLLWSTNTLGMTRNVFGRIFDGLLGSTGLDYSLLARRIHSRLYTDMTMLGDLFVRIGMPPNFFEMMARDEKGQRPGFKPSFRQMIRLRRVFPFLWRHARVDREIRRFLVQQNKALDRFRKADWQGARPELLLDQARALRDLHSRSQWYIFLAALNSMVRKRILDRMVRRHTPQVDPGDLIRGLAGLKALEPNRRLHELAEIARTLPADQLAILDEQPPDVIEEHLAKSERGRRLLAGFAAFQEDFGFLSANGTDFSGTSWVERPELVWRMVARNQGTMQLSPAGEAAQIRRRTRLRVRQDLHPLQRGLFGRLLRSTVVYLGLRERVSLLLSEDAFQMRRVFLALGQGLVETAGFEEQDDIFYLYFEELASLVNGDLSPPAARELVAGRRREIAADAELQPPDTICGDLPIAGLDMPEPNGDFLAGIGGSSGSVQGRARIVRDPLAAPEDLGPDDILVVPFTDVGWTPLFAGIGGIVAETGGQLSHTAIVAREYNLPAVVSVPGVTRKLSEFQPITVDGLMGRVYLGHVLEKKELPA